MDRGVIERLFAEWERGDFTRAPELFDEAMAFSAAQPEGQVTATGPAGVRDFMARFLPEWEQYRVELRELEDLGGGRWLATGTQHGRGITSGMQIDAPAHIAIEMTDGRMTQLHFFFTREEALAALAR